MNTLIALPVMLPLLGAGVAVGLVHRRVAQRLISVMILSVVTLSSVVMLIRVDHDGPFSVQVGDWASPIGISLVVDRFAAIMLVVASVMLLAVVVFAIGHPGAESGHGSFHPVYLILAAGIAMAFLTGDLFNLFVAFEVTLMASYVLITLGGRLDQVRNGMTYIVINLIASTVFLISLAFIYAATGTVNLADLHVKIADLPDGVRSGLAVLLMVVFGVKAALFPLFFWLPDSYPTASLPITAVFAGLLTKVGVYAIIRSQTLLFPIDTRPGGLLLLIAGLTMVVGVLGAISRNDMKRILSFHIVSQIGYMMMGLGLFTIAGLAGAVFYIVHHIVVKTSLFLVAGLVEQRAGSSELARISGVARLEPLLAVLFLVPALSLAGIPPFSGFVAKLALVEAGLSSQEYLIVVASLVVSLLTIYSMNKIWSNAFWGRIVTESNGSPAPARSGWVLMTGATATLVAISIAIAVWAGPLYAFSQRTAGDLIETHTYVERVLGP